MKVTGAAPGRELSKCIPTCTRLLSPALGDVSGALGRMDGLITLVYRGYVSTVRSGWRDRRGSNS